MDKKQAIKIVRETFEASFDKARFTNFIKNLLNEPDLTDGFGPRTGNYIPDSFKGYIEKYERLGKYEDSDEKRIDLLIVHLKKETSIERARSMQRNFVAGYLQGKFGSDAPKDAALVAFVAPLTSSPSPSGRGEGVREDWRFSLVKLETKIKAGEKGIKVKDEFTPAKRWSFLVGKNERSHTAQTQFVPVMQDTDNNPTLAELEEAFNIEKVTKEFFLKYRGLFIWTKDELDKAVRRNPKTKGDFESKGIDTVNLAKKLLGQIIFLYYLQKKGWFGVPADAAWGEGSRQFLRELFAQCKAEKKNFFNDYLEPLFYEALRYDRSDVDHYFSRFDCKIPFLNGGLFDPMNNYDWVRTEILIPNELFSNKNKTDEGDEGDGILDIFDRYNFTVKEDEPFEKEVAIDPELLGKAYEKFNAIRPDNYKEFLEALKSGKKGEESKFNKQYGVYYTPREIVHYMCQQSLINYLYSELNPLVSYQDLGKDQLDMFGNAAKGGQMDMTVEHKPMAEVPKEDIALLIQHGEHWRENEARVDAAGKETDTYSYKMPESIRQNTSLLDEKLAAIKVCDPAVGSGAFPVGMMSEIVKARQALAVYLSTKDTKSTKGKTSYDFKRECIENSLYGVDIDSGAVEIAKLRLWLSLVVDEDDPQNIKPLPNLDYKIVCGNSLIGFPQNWGSPIEKEIESLIHQHFNETDPKKKDELKKKIDEKIESRYKNSLRAFGYQVNFDFNTVFSEVFQTNNGFDVMIGNPPYVRIQSLDKKQVEYFNRDFLAATGSYDIYVLFVERCLQLIKRQAVLSFILPNKFMQVDYGSGLRKLLSQNSYVEQIVDFRAFQIFETATTYTCLLFLKKSMNPTLNLVIPASLEECISELRRVPSRRVSSSTLTASAWTLSDDLSSKLLQKLKDSKSVALLDLPADMSRGSSTGGDDIFILKTKNASRYETNDGLTVDIESDILRVPLYATDYGRYEFAPAAKERIIFPYLVKEDTYILLGEDVFKRKYPKAYAYLLSRKAELKKRKDYKTWYAFSAPRNLHLHDIAQIVIPLLADKGLCSLLPTNQSEYCLMASGGFSISILDKSLSPTYAIGVLNSKVIFWYLQQISNVFRGGWITCTKQYVGQLPIRQINFDIDTEKKLYDRIVKLVERVLAAKRANPQADTSKLEGEIDQLVYQLYGLTEEEIKIVEGK